VSVPEPPEIAGNGVPGNGVPSRPRRLPGNMLPGDGLTAEAGAPLRPATAAYGGTVVPRDVTAMLLGAPERYTRGEIAGASGVDPQIVRRYWRALGFASAADDAVAFTDADINALGQVHDLVEALDLTEEEMVRLIRAIGRTTARLAEWVTEEYLEWSRVRGADPAARAGLSALGALDGPQREAALREAALESALPQLDEMVLYAFRRQLAAAVGRALDVPRDELRSPLAVGFGDLVGYTQLARRLSPHDLAALVERFETVAADVIAAGAGRLVKTLGDEVLFAADEPTQAADIALELIARLAYEAGMPQIRVGLAYGEVVTRMGDIFGSTVNLASRLTSVAPRGGVIVDRPLAEALREHGGYRLAGLRRRPIRGFGLVDATRLRSAR
jgi:adenylate cyclase